METSKSAYIETIGCQMNERDSEIMAQLLAEADIHRAATIEEADVIVVNTCSIRAKAEQKAYSLLGTLRKIKDNNPALVIAVTGCMAQQEGNKLFSRIPYIDLVVGPQNIYRLPELLHATLDDKKKGLATSLSPTFAIPRFLPTLEAGVPFKRFVTIMQGCNNYCTYCVVPFTRGREISRNFNDIIAEVKHLSAHGVKEITLIGQNVNSYGLDQKNGVGPEGLRTFPDLLRAVAAVAGIERIRFTTSNPKDLSEDLMRCFSELEALCPHFHLPVQSGSNHILKRMNRKYTIESYLQKVALLRQYRPDIALTTDFIVGFPGESDEDFALTMAVLETVRYHATFSFKYSDRPAAKASSFEDKVPEEVKSERLARLQKRQEEITLERNQEYVGRILEVMVEGESKTAAGQWSGRSGTNHIVNFSSPALLVAGQTVRVVIREGCLHSLRGVEMIDGADGKAINF